MKKNLKKLFTMLLVVLLVTGCGCAKNDETKNKGKEPEVKVNTAENVIKDQTFEGLQFTNTSLTVVDGISKFVTQVSNNTGADYNLVEFTVTIKDAEGNIIISIPGYVGEVIKNGETRSINHSIDIDLSNASSIEYAVVK